MSSHLASHPVHLHTPVSGQLVKRNESGKKLSSKLTLTVERVLLQVWGNAAVLVLLVGVVVVGDVHLPVLHLLLLPPEKRILGLQQF